MELIDKTLLFWLNLLIAVDDFVIIYYLIFIVNVEHYYYVYYFRDCSRTSFRFCNYFIFLWNILFSGRVVLRYNSSTWTKYEFCASRVTYMTNKCDDSQEAGEDQGKIVRNQWLSCAQWLANLRVFQSMENESLNVFIMSKHGHIGYDLLVVITLYPYGNHL